jgi:hypothetical protein
MFMQMTTSEPISQMPVTTIPHLNVRWEFVAYVALVCLALVIRLAMLDTIPMSDNEALRSLGAWQIMYPNPEVNMITPDSVITTWAQTIGLSIINRDEFGARIITVIAGILLILSPLLFRERLGIGRTFLFSLVLGLSSIPLATSRTSDPMTWSALLGMLFLWSLARCWNNRTYSNATIVSLIAVSLLFLNGASGILTLIVLAGGLAILVYWTAYTAPSELDTPSEEVMQSVSTFLSDFPYRSSLPIAFGVAFLVATGFMIYQAGLGIVVQGFASFITGFWTPFAAFTPPAYPLIILAVYDLLLVLFALIAYYLLEKNNLAKWDVRFAMGLILVGAIVAILYRGSTPSFALLMVLPMAYIVAIAVNELLSVADEYPFTDLWSDETQYYPARNTVIKWVIALILCGALVMLGTHWQIIGRALLTFPTDVTFSEGIQRLLSQEYANSLRSLLWVVLAGLFFFVGGFLVASIWDNTIAIQGIGLGFFAFMLVSGMGGGYNAVVAQANQAGDLWKDSIVQSDYVKLRTTLQELSRRNVGGTNELNITLVRDTSIRLNENGIMGWLVRDYPNARFVDTVDVAARDEIIIMMESLESEPDLGGSYVGQNFALRQYWTVGQVPLWDWIALLAQRRVRVQSFPTDHVILWLRLDVYNALPLDAER